jgi:predicted DNA-binding protein (MmcQ/YjbR family)
VKSVSTVSESTVLAKIRRICEKLPLASETVTFGHPTFQLNGKTFAVLEVYKGELGLALKVEQSLQSVFLKDPRFPSNAVHREAWLGNTTHSRRPIELEGSRRTS